MWPWPFGTHTRWLRRINQQLADITWRLQIMAGELDDLRAAVAKNGTVVGSAIVLLQGLKVKLDEAIADGGIDPAEVAALSAELGAKTDQLAAAVVANTPAEEPAPAPVPVPEPEPTPEE